MSGIDCRVLGSDQAGAVACEVSWVEPVPCRFCRSPAVATFDLDRGCACFPDDRHQALCVQHVLRRSPLGSFDLARDLTVDLAFTALVGKRTDARGQPVTVDVAIVPFSEELAAVLDGNPVVFDGRTTIWLERAEGVAWVLRIHNDGGHSGGGQPWTVRPEAASVSRGP